MVVTSIILASLLAYVTNYIEAMRASASTFRYFISGPILVGRCWVWEHAQKTVIEAVDVELGRIELIENEVERIKRY